MDRIFSCNNEKMSTHSIGSNTVQCCSIWHEKAWPKVTDDDVGFFWWLPLRFLCITSLTKRHAWLAASITPPGFCFSWYWSFQFLLTKNTLSNLFSSLSCCLVLSFADQTSCMLPATTSFGVWCPCQYPARSGSFFRTSSLSWLFSWRWVHFTLLLNSPRFN